MKKAVKKSVVLLLAVLMTLSLMMTGCSSTNKATTSSKAVSPSSSTSSTSFVSTLKGKGLKADGTPLKVGLVYGDLESDYVIYQSEYLKYMLEAAGCQVTVLNSNQNVQTESGFIDDLIQKKVDCVVTSVVDSNGSSATFKKLNAANIPIIAVIRNVNATMDFCITTSDNVVTGEKCMQYLADLAKGKKVTVASVQGNLGTSDAADREKGYANVLKANTNISYSPNPCNWTSQAAQAAITDVLTKNPNLWGIACHSDAMTPGVLSALTQAGKLHKVGESGHINWVSIDGGAPGLKAIRDGYMDAVIDQSPLTNAVTTAKVVLDYVAQGKSGDGKTINVQTTLVTIKNVNDAGWWGDYDIKDVTKGIDWPGTEKTWNDCGI
jgi:ABC-type sugar transport system substrate-binding protein